MGSRARLSRIGRIFLIISCWSCWIAFNPGTSRAQGAVKDKAQPASVGYAVRRLNEAGLDPAFVSYLALHHDPGRREDILDPNLLGFLSRADYSGHYSAKALRRCREFMRRNATVLRRAEKRFGVSKEVITALLWVETKHGKLEGRFNVPDVYFTLVQADYPSVMTDLVRAANERTPAAESQAARGPKDLKATLAERAKRKSEWAVEQLKALQSMRASCLSCVRSLRGSFAGAFGMPQFVPSSYLQWASATSARRRPNLFRVGDATLSVAHFLEAHGWSAEDAESQRKALFEYNHSEGYGAVILKIAHEL